MDVVHAIHVEVVTSQALALLSAGAEVNPQEMLDRFDAALHEDTKAGLSPEMAELRRVLGV